VTRQLLPVKLRTQISPTKGAPYHRASLMFATDGVSLLLDYDALFN